MANSPWGFVNHVTSVERGVAIINSPSHGGIRIAEGYANNKLTPSARARAIYLHKAYFWEEDCAYAIPAFELPHLWSKLRVDEKHLMTSLSRWNPDYLIERGVFPLYAPYVEWMIQKEGEKMRANKVPDFIISAINNGFGVVTVTTADLKTHNVSAESYTNRSGLNLLSNLKKIEITND